MSFSKSKLVFLVLMFVSAITLAGTVLDLDFENYEVGALHGQDGWVVQNDGEVDSDQDYIISDVQGYSGNGIEFRGKVGDVFNAWAYKPITVIAASGENLEISAMLKLKETGTPNVHFMCVDGTTPWNGNYYLKFGTYVDSYLNAGSTDPNAYFHYYDADLTSMVNTGVPAVKGSWYKLKVIYDLVNFTYDFTVQPHGYPEVKLAESIASGGGIPTHFFIYRGLWETEKFCVDDIKIQTVPAVKDISVLLDADFDDYSDGSLSGQKSWVIQNYDIETSAGHDFRVQSSQFYGKVGKSLSFYKGTGTVQNAWAYTGFELEDSSDTFVELKLMLRAQDTGNRNIKFYMTDDGENPWSGNKIAVIGAWYDSVYGYVFHYMDETNYWMPTEVRFDKGLWYQLRVVYDMINSSYSFYLSSDGSLEQVIAEDIAVTSDGFPKFFFIWGGQWGDDRCYIDNIEVSSYVPSCAVALAQGQSLVGDLNSDCYVDLLDLRQIAINWLKCFDPANLNCEN